MKKIMIALFLGITLPQDTIAQVPPMIYAKNSLKRYKFTLSNVDRCPGVVPLTISTGYKSLASAIRNPYLCSGSRTVVKLLPGARYVVEDNGRVRREQ